MAKKLSLSPFKISMFLECPKKYKFHYIDNLSVQFQKPKPYLTMGEHVHSALKDFFEKPPGKRNKKLLEELLRKHWKEKREGFKNVEEERKYGLSALEMLSGFYDSFDTKVEPIELEQNHKLQLSDSLVLSGKIDRVDKEEGGLSIIDYKTGSESDDEEKLQLVIYSIIINKKTEKPVLRASFLYLKSGNLVSIEPNKKMIDEGIKKVKKIAGKIEKEKEFKAKVNKFCKWCDYISICPEKDNIIISEDEPF